MTNEHAAASAERFDVAILGGGLAGLCLARQLARNAPEARVLVLEKRAHPVPEAAFKVGESSVEAGAYYFAEELGLADHIAQDQLPKFGLRFFFNQPDAERLSAGMELGLTRRLRNPSFQLDRGRLENYMAAEMPALGVDFRSGCAVREAALGEDGERHRIVFERDGAVGQVDAKWVVDASGRAQLLKRNLGLAQPAEHDVNAVWFRYDRSIRIDDWEDWPVAVGEREGERDVTTARWLSTNHLMGEGYWVWLIPLASGCTSVGIVADPRFHPLSSLNSFERAMAWLHRHEPLCAAELDKHREGLMDFLALKRFSYDCKQVFSENRWALTGEAGLFLDPFYSPGSDFIAFGNTFIADLIGQDLAGRPIAARASIYDQLYRGLFHNTLPVYRDQYGQFGNPRVMTAKIIWDYAVYWAFPAFLLMQGQLTNVGIYPGVRAAMTAINALNRNMQDFFRAWGAQAQPPLRNVFIDQAAIPLVPKLNADLAETYDDKAFQAKLRENEATLRALSDEIVRAAANGAPALQRFLPDPPPASAAPPVLADVFAALGMQPDPSPVP